MRTVSERRPRSQRGFTLVEMAAALAITGMLLTGLSVALVQLQNSPRRSIDDLSVQAQFRAATAALHEDAANAQSFEAGTAPAYGTFRWVDLSLFPPAKSRVVYSFEDGALMRQQYLDDVAQPAATLLRNLRSASDVVFDVQTTPNPSAPTAMDRLLTVTMTLFTEDRDGAPVPNTTTVRVSLRPQQTAAIEHLFLYLHNRPTPPVGNTRSQTDLPLTTAKPTATQLFNYDTNRDNRPGLKLVRTSNPNESNNARHQDWVTDAFPSGTVIDGRIGLYLPLAATNFQTGRRMVVDAFVRDLDSATNTTTLVGNRVTGTFVSTQTWSTLVLQTDRTTYTLPAGHKLVVTVQFNTESATDGMIAYDTTAYPTLAAVPTRP